MGKRSQTGHYKIEGAADGYLWNVAAGLVNAGEAVVLSMVVTRTTGLEDAGILSLAFAVGNLMMTVGKFGVRSYQATDIEEKFSFSDYFWARIVTVSVMLAASFAYLAYCAQIWGTENRKVAVILSICLIYAVESMEDVFWGLYQLRMALDAGAKIFVARWMLILTVTVIFLLTGGELPEALAAGVLAGVVLFVVYNTAVFCRFHEKIGRFRAKAVKRLSIECTPLFAISFFSFYITNAPKYAIDKYLSQEVCACYGFISMPVFVIGLLNGFLYQPALVQMAVEWKERRLQHFYKRVKKQCAVVAALTALCMAGGWLCGIPVLSAVYGTDLSGYQAELLLLLFGGGMLAYSGYFCVLFTIMRKQRVILYGYAVIAALAAGCMGAVTKNFGVIGVVVLFDLLLVMLAGIFAWMLPIFSDGRKNCRKI